jgi:outer membrane lipoprotein-sorting protein
MRVTPHRPLPPAGILKSKSMRLGILISTLLLFPLSGLPAAPEPQAAQSLPAPSARQDQQVQKIIRTIDELYRSRTSRARMEMNVVTPQWERTLTLEAWTQGMDKTFVRILQPKKERGVATLRLKNEMWNYLPNTNKVIKIPPSMMMGSWMGSDFTNDDLVKEYNLKDDYTVTLTVPPDAEAGLLYLDCRPRPGLPVVWDRVLVAVRAEDDLPVWQKFFDEKGKLMRTMNFRDIRTFGSKRIPSVMELVPQNKEGQKTTVRFLDIAFDVKIADDVFTLRNLSRPI